MKSIPLKVILDTLEKTPYFPPPSEEVTLAILNDSFRDLGIHPLSEAACTDPVTGFTSKDFMLLSYLAFTLMHTPLGSALRGGKPRFQDAENRLRPFLDSLREIPFETLPKNAFRREELLRKWLALLGLSIESETPEKSAARLSSVDYHRLKQTMVREEEERKRVAAEWARKQAEAAAKAAAEASAQQSSGSYE